jgi:Flp pilus assembly protein TadD
MKNVGLVFSLLALSLSCAEIVKAQEDEARRATGLPMMIGQNSSNPVNASLSGKVIINETADSQPKPIIFVAVYFGGALIDRRQVTDSGSYFVPSIPREGSILSIESGGIEVSRYQIPPSISGSIRQDVVLNQSQIQNSREKPGVISARNFYRRTESNQKIFDKASAAVKEKKLENATEFYRQLTKNDAQDFIAWTELGTLYFRNAKFDEAEIAYQNALEQKPDFPVALVNSGKLYLERKQPEKAVAVLSKAVEIEPNSADAQHYLGESYLQIKKGSKAVGHLNEAIRLAPIEKAEIHLRLAQLYNGANLKDKAVEEYKLFLGKVPDYKDRDKLEKYVKDNSPK